MSTDRILLVDGRAPEDSPLRSLLASAGYDVDPATDTESARARLGAGDVSLVLSDPAFGGATLLEVALALPAGPPVVLLDDFASVRDAVEYLRRGAFEFLAGPSSDERVLETVRRALERSRLVAENASLRRDLGERFAFSGLESRSPAMNAVFHTLEAVADTSATVLLSGESGTGKTVLARALHERSARAERAFVVVDCGALPGGLLESELFGHATGAFTGAVRARAGKFEAADGGTLLLDEISNATPDLQQKLLRVLEEGRFHRVGEDDVRSVDVRVVAASNRDLAAEVEAGRFREDLYWRLHVIAVELPPLRERPGDVALLAERFARRFAARHGRPTPSLSPEALARLCAHDWPGNVRELEHALERAVLLARRPELSADDLDTIVPVSAPADVGGLPGEPPLGPLRAAMEGPERRFLVRALEHCGGRRQAAARLLGINRTTLFNKMRKYNLLDFPTAPAVADEAEGAA